MSMIKQKHFIHLAAVVTTLFVVLVSGKAEAKRKPHERVHHELTVASQHKERFNKPRKLYKAVGIASFYGSESGNVTANGEKFSPRGLTAAHRTLKLPTIVRVTNLKNGKSIKVRVNDRGPYVKGRLIDLSQAAARMIGITHKDGLSRVEIVELASNP